MNRVVGGYRRLHAHVAGSLRTRFALAFATVAVAVAASVGLLSYHAASDRIFQEIDTSLRSAAVALDSGQTDLLDAPVERDRRGRHGQPRQLTAQVVAADGTATLLSGASVRLPVSQAVRAIAASPAGPDRTDVIETDVDGESYRILTVARTGGGALQVAAEVEDAEHVLNGMAGEIALVSSAVLLVAAGAGWVLAGRITRRLEGLAAIAEEVSRHGGVDREVSVSGSDEVARLSMSFNTMLGRLAAARDDQERLIQDAAHELRTPLTSLRTNASVLGRFVDLGPEARTRLVDDLQGETRELSHLVDELVELALARRGDDDPEEAVDLAAIAAEAGRRVQRRTGRQVRVHCDGAARATVRGRRQGLERALGNLVENAAKFDPGREPIEVHIREGRVTVSDRGPGIDTADAVRVFDRFYRADGARALPGSGLGLSIVHDVARTHDGTVFAGTRPGGGAAVGFTVGAARLLSDSRPGNDDASPTLEDT